AGFANFKTLPFPQQCYPTGWWSCTLARKAGGFEFREADAKGKRFDSKYYNAGIHHGALSTPAFVAQALGE
ncbi:polyamine aminopropyltransferase, partial [Lysobacter sp. 2RAB21]